MLAASAMDPDSDDGYLFLVFKPELLVPLADFKRAVAGLIDRIKGVARAPGVAEIRIPGERGFKSRERLSREGLEIDRLVYDALAALHRQPPKISTPSL
jgi:LDH2 family malate/lactate/ureidoglycolate dehydrogenase